MGDVTGGEIFETGQFVTDLSKRVAQYMLEHPSNGAVTFIKVAQISVSETGGIVVGVTVDVLVEDESWAQAVASQVGGWAAGGAVAISI